MTPDNDDLVILHEMEMMARRIQKLENEISGYDCRRAGKYSETSGSHCSLENKCLRCRAEDAEAALTLDKHHTAEKPGTLFFNEVTGLHAEADLYRIAELEGYEDQSKEMSNGTI